MAAQVFCWIGMITRNNLFHIYEECLWFLIGYTYYWQSPKLIIRCIAFVYCCYMIFLDIPMYVYRFMDQYENSFMIYNVHDCMMVYDLSDEYLWRTGYFVGASRLSMLM